MDVTFQNSIDIPDGDEEQEEHDSSLFETAAEDATPAKRKFSYAAAMEQLDDSWLAPTPKQPSRISGHYDDDHDNGLDSTIEEEDEGVGVGKCLETRWSESPVKDEFFDETMSTVKNYYQKDDEAILPSPSGPAAALAPAPRLSSSIVMSGAATTTTTSSPTATVAPLTNQGTILSPNIEPSADTTSAIFRHPSIHHNKNGQDQITTSSCSLQRGHPVNESYDSVEQRKQQLEQNKNCISSFLVDRDRVETDILMNRAGGGAIGGDDDNEEEGGGGDLNNSVLNTFEEEQLDEVIDGDLKETDLSLENDDGYFNNSVIATFEKREEDEAELTLTQAADCTVDSDGFLKKIEYAENDEDDLVHDYYEEGVVDGNDARTEESDGAVMDEGGYDNCMTESLSEYCLTNPSSKMPVEENVTMKEEENAEDEVGEIEGNKKDMNEFVPVINLTNPKSLTESVAKNDNDDDEKDGNAFSLEHHLSSTSESPTEVNGMKEPISPAFKSSDTCVASNLESDDIVESKPELTSSRGDSLTFSPSADADDTLELFQQVQNTIQSSEVNASTEEVIDSNGMYFENRDGSTSSAPPEGGALDDYLENSTSHQPSSGADTGADLSFDGNSLSASLDVSLSNIDREALFACTFSQQLSPIRQNSSSPHDLSHRQDDDLKGDAIQLPAVLDTSPISESSSPHDCKPLVGANAYTEGAGESLEDFAGPDNADVNKESSIFAVLSQVNADASSNEVVQGELPKNEEYLLNEEDKNVLDISGEDSSKQLVTADAQMEVQKSQIETVTDEILDMQNPNDYELDERNKSLEDLSSYQQSFNSTSSAFLERLRGAAERRKREVTKARFSMERKEKILYEEKEDREVMPTLAEVSEDIVEEPTKTATTMTQVKPFKARLLPSSATVAEPKSEHSDARSTSTIGSKRKSSDALRPHINSNKPYDSAVSAKPPKRLLSGEDASNAKEMNRRRLLQEDDERIRREAVFKARPLPASTLPRGHLGGLEQQRRMSHNGKPVRAGKENSAFKPSSSARAEERAAYNEEKKAREEARRQEQIMKRDALINETNAEIENLKRYLR